MIQILMMMLIGVNALGLVVTVGFAVKHLEILEKIDQYDEQRREESE